MIVGADAASSCSGLDEILMSSMECVQGACSSGTWRQDMLVLTGGMVRYCSATWTLSMGKFCCAAFASSWEALDWLGPFE